MPYDVKWMNNRYRVVDPDTGKVAINSRSGKAVDGGGHQNAPKAYRQVAHIMKSERKRGRTK